MPPLTSEDWLEDARLRSLRALLEAMIVLSFVLAALGFAMGHLFYASISIGSFVVYLMLFARLLRWGVRRVGYIFTITFNLITLIYLMRGRGIFSVHIVLVPAGMFIGALLLEKRHVHVLFATLVTIVAGIGVWKIVWPGRLRVMLPADPAEIVIIALMLVVASILAWIIVEALREMFVDRARAETATRLAREELEIRNESLQVIGELSRRLQRGLPLDEILADAIGVLNRLSRPPHVAVYMLNDDETALELVAQEGFGVSGQVRPRLPLEGSLSGIALRREAVVVTDDMANDDRIEPSIRAMLVENGIKSGVVIPLTAGRSFGAMNLIYNFPRAFSRTEIDTFEAVGQSVALAISNARHVATLEFHAFHDELTGLPNRASFFRDFDAATVGRGDRTAVAVLDIHRFRDVIDTLGHRLGDDLIRAFATKLTAVAGGAEARVFRVGAGEFALLLEDIASPENVPEILNEVVFDMREAICVGGIALNVGSYCGVAIAPEDAVTAEEILRRAQVALRSAENSASPVRRYSVDADQNAPERLSLMADLAKALRTDEIVVYFQPIIEVATRGVFGFEALVRWQHPLKGLLCPDLFLPLAEESDLINDLTDQVVAKSMRQLHEWLQHYPNLSMSVNLSARTLLDRNSSQRLLAIIQAAGVRPSQVAFELTETAIMADRNLAQSMLGRITETGARLAIDDFGTGYSSLSYLRHFPVSEIKIDRSFISDFADGGQSHAIVRSTIGLAQSLGLSVVAEGIEDQRTADALREIDCPFAQGYFFARPAPAAEIERRIAADGTLRLAIAS